MEGTVSLKMSKNQLLLGVATEPDPSQAKKLKSDLPKNESVARLRTQRSAITVIRRTWITKLCFRKVFNILTIIT